MSAWSKLSQNFLTSTLKESSVTLEQMIYSSLLFQCLHTCCFLGIMCKKNLLNTEI